MNIQFMFRTLLIGIVGGLLFDLLNIPMPWMLGPMFAVMAIQLSTSISLQWHPFFRNVGLVITGYTIGYAFTLEAIFDMGNYFPIMLGVNIAFFLLFLLISVVMSTRTNMDHGTAMTCCLPGGLQQIIAFAEEQKQMNVSVVTFYHVLRILLIVTVVPFIVTSNQTPLPHQSTDEGSHPLLLLILLVFCYMAGIIFEKTHLPTGYLLGPVFLIMCFNLAEVSVPVMPDSMLHIAQLVIGIYFGLLLKKEELRFSKKHFFYAFFSSGILIVAAYGMSFWINQLLESGFITSFLSVVPGGLDQMGIIAASVQGDVTVVTAFQLFRILFLSVIVIPFIKFFVTRNRKRGESTNKM